MASEHDFARIERIFQAAADLPKAARQGFVARECGPDAPLRDRVERMLADWERGSSLAPAPARLGEGPGATIGRYELVREIGEGGFGVVYLARQQEPVVRDVALKILRLGMDTEEVVARFEAERQALALMEHPNIAKVLDGGATASGRPYFVMELVEGRSITEFCDAERLGPRARLELFVDVCEAVQHAHQKGVLHRDIKPSNVLVARREGRAEAKVIDFGIAKAIHTPLTSKEFLTAHHRFLGTPAYMSPEQAQASAVDVDTRSDVYSLGVLLYELLTGSTPFDTRTLSNAGVAGIQRILREEEPPRPSARVSTTRDAAVAECRQLDTTANLGRQLRGELDWIVMRALEKERARRYGAASELAGDVQRYLRDEPVLAGPPSTLYRLRKFLARNRVAAVWAAMLLLALLGGIVGTSLGMLEAGRQRDDARREALHAKRITDFLVSTLALSNPDVAREPELSVGRLLDRTAASVEGSLGGDAWAEARVRGTIGLAYDSLGRNRQAEVQLRRAAELMAQLEEFPGDEFYTVLWSLTAVLFRLERPDALATAMWARRVGLEHLGLREPELARALDAFIFQAEEAAHSNQPGALDPAQPLFTASMELAEARLEVGDPLWSIVADTLKHGSLTLWYSPHEAESAAFWEKALEIEERERDPNDPVWAETLAQLVGVLNRAGRAPEAEERVRGAVLAMREIFKEGTFQLCFLEAMLGQNLVEQGQFEEAEPYLLSSHAGLLANVGDVPNFFALDSYGRLIALYSGWGRQSEAQGYRDALAALGARAHYPLPFAFLDACLAQGSTALRTGLAELERLCGTVTFTVARGEVQRPELPAAVDAVLDALATDARVGEDLAVCIARQLRAWSALLGDGHRAERGRLLDYALATLRPRGNAVLLDLAEGCAARAELYLEAGERDAAGVLADEAWGYAQLDLREDDWVAASAKARTARSLIALERYSEAEVLLVASLATMGEQLGRQYRDTREVQGLLRLLYTSSGQPELAQRYGIAAD